MIAVRVRSESDWNSTVSFCEQFILAKGTAEWDRDRFNPPGPWTGQMSQTTQTPEIAKRSPSFISAGQLRPSITLSEAGRGGGNGLSGFPCTRGGLLQTVGGQRYVGIPGISFRKCMLVPRLQQPEKACGFSRLESDIITSLWYTRKISDKKRWLEILVSIYTWVYQLFNWIHWWYVYNATTQ